MLNRAALENLLIIPSKLFQEEKFDACSAACQGVLHVLDNFDPNDERVKKVRRDTYSLQCFAFKKSGNIDGALIACANLLILTNGDADVQTKFDELSTKKKQMQPMLAPTDKEKPKAKDKKKKKKNKKTPAETKETPFEIEAKAFNTLLEKLKNRKQAILQTGNPDYLLSAAELAELNTLSSKQLLGIKEIEAIIDIFNSFANFYREDKRENRNIEACLHLYTLCLNLCEKLQALDQGKAYDLRSTIHNNQALAYETICNFPEAITALKRAGLYKVLSKTIDAKALESYQRELSSRIQSLREKIPNAEEKKSDAAQPVKASAEEKSTAIIKKFKAELEIDINEYNKNIEPKLIFEDKQITEAATQIYEARKALNKQQMQQTIDLCTQALRLLEPIPLYEALSTRAWAYTFSQDPAHNTPEALEQIIEDAKSMRAIKPDLPRSFFYLGIAEHFKARISKDIEEYDESYDSIMAGINIESKQLTETSHSREIPPVQECALSTLIECDHQRLFLLSGDDDPLKEVSHFKNQNKLTTNAEAHFKATAKARKKAEDAYLKGKKELTITWYSKAIILNTHLLRRKQETLLSMDYGLYAKRAIAYSEVHDYRRAFQDLDTAIWICQHRLAYRLAQPTNPNKKIQDIFQCDIYQLKQDMDRYNVLKQDQIRESAEWAIKLEEMHKALEEKEHKNIAEAEKRKQAAEEEQRKKAEREEVTKASQPVVEKPQEPEAARSEQAEKEKQEIEKAKAAAKEREAEETRLRTEEETKHRAEREAEKAKNRAADEAARLEKEKRRAENIAKDAETKQKAAERKRESKQIKKSKEIHTAMLREIQPWLAKRRLRETQIVDHKQSHAKMLSEMKALHEQKRRPEKTHREVKEIEHLHLVSQLRRSHPVRLKETEKFQTLSSDRATFKGKYKAIVNVRHQFLERSKTMEATLLAEQKRLHALLRIATPAPISPASESPTGSEMKSPLSRASESDTDTASPSPSPLSASGLNPSPSPVSARSSDSERSQTPSKEVKYIPPIVSLEKHFYWDLTNVIRTLDPVTIKILTTIDNIISQFEERDARLTLIVGGLPRDLCMGYPVIKQRGLRNEYYVDADIETDADVVTTKKLIKALNPKSLKEKSTEQGTLFIGALDTDTGIQIEFQILCSFSFAKEQTPTGYIYRNPDPTTKSALGRDQAGNAAFMKHFRIYTPLAATKLALSEKAILPIPGVDIRLSFNQDPRRLLRILIDSILHPEKRVDKGFFKAIPESLYLLLRDVNNKPRSDLEINLLNICLFDKVFKSSQTRQIFDVLYKHGIIDILFPGLMSSVQKYGLMEKLFGLFDDKNTRLDLIFADMIVLQHYEYFNSLSRAQIADNTFLLNEIVKLIQRNPLYRVCYTSFHQRTCDYQKDYTEKTVDNGIIHRFRKRLPALTLCDTFRNSIAKCSLAYKTHNEIASHIATATMVRGVTYHPVHDLIHGHHSRHISDPATYLLHPQSPSFGAGSLDQRSSPAAAGQFTHHGHGTYHALQPRSIVIPKTYKKI